MADDTMLKERLVRAGEAPAPAPRLDDVTRRARIIRWRRAGAGAVVAGIVLTAIAVPLSGLLGLRHEKAPVGSIGARGGRVIGFEPAPGWAMGASPATDLVLPSTVWVANVPFAGDDLGDAYEEEGILRFPAGPGATIEQLPPSGILVEASIVAESRNALPPNATFPVRRLPLRLPDRPAETAWEGYTRGHSRHMILATVNGRWVDVRIRYGTQAPDDEMLAEAQEELDRLFVKPAPPPTDTIDQFGISLAVADGVSARLIDSGPGTPILELSTVPLDGASGNPVIPNRDRLGPLDFSIVLAEDDALNLGFDRIALPIEIRPHDRCDDCEVLDDGTTAPDGHALYHRSFEKAGRSFDLYVEFGSSTPGSGAWESVYRVLGTIEIAPR